MKPLLLMILDGFGMAEPSPVNAISCAATPNFDALWKTCAHTTLGASGLSVGLPDGQMGNSEVGHTNIGAGRIVYQELTRITKAIEDGDFFQNPALCAAMDRVRENGGTLHLAGLLSSGGVHSHNSHLFALVRMAKERGLSRVAVHAITDGRDVPPDSGLGFVRELEEKLAELGCGTLASISGRYYAMDRDNRWERVEKAYRAIALGEGEGFPTGTAAMEASYAAGVTDEFVVPVTIGGGASVCDGDSFIFVNVRPDRARELTRALVDPDFTGFAREKKDLLYVCMTQYDATMPGVRVAFEPQSLKNTLGEYLSALGKTQLRIAETEKYAHVTFFFNGGREEPYKGEDRKVIPSPKVATYDLQPEMSAPEVCDEVVRRVESDKYDVIILNFANCDMVGHTGVFEAAVKAVETVDACVGRIVEAVTNKGGAILLTADHGNADKMADENGEPFTAHTTNPVPLILIGAGGKLKNGGVLADLAPTMLDLLQIPKPAEMTGRSLLIR